MTQKQIKQTIFAALRCPLSTANYCLQTLQHHTPDSLRKADTMDVHYYTYEDGRQNPDIIIFNTKFNDDPIPWHFSIYL